MSETAISVTDAAKDFLRLLELVERKREPAILVREGKAVATLTPVPQTAHNCAELADAGLNLNAWLQTRAKRLLPISSEIALREKIDARILSNSQIKYH